MNGPGISALGGGGPDRLKAMLAKLGNIDFAGGAVWSLLVLWVSTTFSIALMEIAFVAALVLWVISRLRARKEINTLFRRKNDTGRETIDWVLWGPLALFVTLVFFSFFTSEYPVQSFRGLFKISKPLIVFLMAMDLLQTETAQKKYWFGFLLAFLLVMVDSAYQYAFGKDFLRGFAAQDSSAGLRLVGPFGDFGKMGSYLVLVIPVFGMRFFAEFRGPAIRRQGFYYLALAVAGLILLYLTRSRGAFLALILGVFFFCVLKRWFKALLIGVLLSAALVIMAPRGMIVHLDAVGKEQSLVERYYLWRRALDVIVAKPFLGTGINTYNKAHAKYDTVQQKSLILLQSPAIPNPDGSVSFTLGGNGYVSDPNRSALWIDGKKYNLTRDADGQYFAYNDVLVRGYYAHNGYLQLAAEIGIPGIFFFLTFLFIYFTRAIRAMVPFQGSSEELVQLGIVMGLLAFLIRALSDTCLQSPPSLMSFWLLAGVLVARQRMVSQ